GAGKGDGAVARAALSTLRGLATREP
ncbi:SagB/ThcOx family dehydrogenase, partial [Salmonella sp. gx-f8]|nr:SagB/ThcOx family dehydrogenase [Salmonella sp. gx-f8]